MRTSCAWAATLAHSARTLPPKTTRGTISSSWSTVSPKKSGVRGSKPRGIASISPRTTEKSPSTTATESWASDHTTLSPPCASVYKRKVMGKSAFMGAPAALVKDPVYVSVIGALSCARAKAGHRAISQSKAESACFIWMLLWVDRLKPASFLILCTPPLSWDSSRPRTRHVRVRFAARVVLKIDVMDTPRPCHRHYMWRYTRHNRPGRHHHRSRPPRQCCCRRWRKSRTLKLCRKVHTRSHWPYLRS